MKDKRHSIIRELLVKTSVPGSGARGGNGASNGSGGTGKGSSSKGALGNGIISNQDELRRKLAGRGIHVTQATLSRDIRELKLMKGPTGYALPGGDAADQEDELPAIAEIFEGFALDVQQAQNQLVLHTVTGGAQPVAASVDYEEWPEVVGTIAGDNTVLIICPDTRAAASLKSRIEAFLA